MSKISGDERMQGYSVSSCSSATFTNDGNLLFASQGSWLHCYGLGMTRTVDKFKIWESGQAIHKIVICAQDNNNILLLLHGGRRLSFATINVATKIYISLLIFDFDEWIWCVCMNESKHNYISFYLGTGRNQVHKCHYTLSTNTIHCTEISACSETSSLYCMTLVKYEEDITAICGTIFGQILIWKPQFSHNNTNNNNVIQSLSPSISLYTVQNNILYTNNKPKESIIPTTNVSYHLQGHEGAVFHVSSLDDHGYTLASASDDRSVRIWKYKYETDTYSCVSIGFGHLARVFRVCFIGEQYVASGGEDGFCRVFNTENGELVQSYPCQRGGLRCLDYSSKRKLLVSGGKNSSIQIYNVSGLLGKDNSITRSLLSVKNIVNNDNNDNNMKIYPKCISVVDLNISYFGLNDGRIIQSSNNHNHISTMVVCKIENEPSCIHCLYYNHTNYLIVGDRRGYIHIYKQNRNNNMNDNMNDYSLYVKWKAMNTSILDVLLCKDKMDECIALDGKGLAIRYNISNSNHIAIYTLQTEGNNRISSIAMTRILDDKKYAICGTSKGSIQLFSLSNASNNIIINPIKAWFRVHDKSSVTAITCRDVEFTSNILTTSKSNIIYSAGGDGRIIEYILSNNTLTQIRIISCYQIIFIHHIVFHYNCMYVCGHSNKDGDYIIYDIGNDYQIARVQTEGSGCYDFKLIYNNDDNDDDDDEVKRQQHKQHKPPSWSFVHAKQSSSKLSSPHIVYTSQNNDIDYRFPLHGSFHNRAITSMDFVPNSQELIVTASEDKSIYLSKIMHAEPQTYKLLDAYRQHPDVVKNICIINLNSNMNDNMNCVLVFSVGGQSSMHILKIKNERFSTLSNSIIQCNESVTERLLCVTAEENMHNNDNDDDDRAKELIVCSGNSSGFIFMHSFSCSNKIQECKFVLMKQEQRHSAPVLCMKMMFGLLCSGDTNGIIKINNIYNNNDNDDNIMLIHKVHDAGVNCLDLYYCNDNDKSIIICTGGDDTKVCVTLIQNMTVISAIMDKTHYSSVKAIKMTIMNNNNQNNQNNDDMIVNFVLLSTGFDKRVHKYNIMCNLTSGVITKNDDITMYVTDVDDVSAMCVNDRSNYMCIGGDGMEIINI